MEPEQVAAPLLAWFDGHGRKDLPWQRGRTPYRVWVSEIMLQQTRVAAVIPYFQRFMARFPAVTDLAAADTDEVLHLWSGLGYYARARNLHKTAGVIVSQHHGRFPRDIRRLRDLPGIGRSTAGAILSLAYGQRHPILDGNVKRILARCFAVPGWPGRNSVLRRMWELADACTPRERIGAYNQALMDLGATLCTHREPDCPRCPLAFGCTALTLGEPTAFPEPKPRKTLPVRESRMLLVRNPVGEVLLERRPSMGIWGGLWSLPECDPGQDAADWCLQHLGILPRWVEKLTVRRHTFSHFQLNIIPLQVQLGTESAVIADDNRIAWRDPRQPGELGFAAPIARILREIADDFQIQSGEIQMSRMVHCVKLQREAEGLDRPPYPGDLGKRVFENVSKQAWQDWLRQQTMLINEYRLSPMDPKARSFLEEQMKKFFFGEGSDLPPDYKPRD
jgi:A/G-specific adenine glycosylase